MSIEELTIRRRCIFVLLVKRFKKYLLYRREVGVDVRLRKAVDVRRREMKDVRFHPVLVSLSKKHVRDLFIKFLSIVTSIAFFINILSYDLVLSSPFCNQQAKEGLVPLHERDIG